MKPDIYKAFKEYMGISIRYSVITCKWTSGRKVYIESDGNMIRILHPVHIEVLKAIANEYVVRYYENR